MKRIYKKPVCFSRRLQSGALSVFNNENGQTLVEYALLLVLIAVVVVFMVKGVGMTNYNTYVRINSEVTSAAK